MAKPISSRTAILAVLAAMPGLVHSTPAPVGQEAQSAALDSIEQNLDPVEAQARRSLFGGGSKPVSFSGEALLRFIGTEYDDYPAWMGRDVTETKNSLASIRVAMVAAPHRNLRLWSKVAFNHALMGNMKPGTWTQNSDYYGSMSKGTSDIRENQNFEDMAAGLLAKTGPITTQAKVGGVLWTEASPLTLWKGQNRMFGWDYVPYELEQSNAQYWEYATLKGEKTGRAAWNKKPFQGLQLESIEMPWNLYYNVTYGAFDIGQKYQPYMINTNTTNGLMATNDYPTSDWGVYIPGTRRSGTKGIGIGDTYRRTFLARLAKAELPLAITAGVNYLNYTTDEDYATQYWKMWSGTGPKDKNGVVSYFFADTADKIGRYRANYFLSSQVASLDFRRNLPGGLQFHVDVAFSNVDTSFFKVEDSGWGSDHWRRYRVADSATVVNSMAGQVIGHEKSGWIPGIYGSVSYPLPIAGKNYDLQLQAIYAPKKFYSGGSFVMPADVFFPYESNLTGAGKFAAADNGTPYVSNMMGANLTAKAPVANGHAKLNFGFHSQMENGSDLIFLPWRLNGTAFNYTLNASTSRYDGATLINDYLNAALPHDPVGTYAAETYQPATAKQIRRMADEYFVRTVNRNPYAPQAGLGGGLRADYMSAFEAFGGFQKRPGVAADTAVIRTMFNSSLIPQSKKATQNFSLDISKDIARYWEGKNSLFLGFYAAANSVTKNGTPVPAFGTGENVLLSSYMLRFEPVVQLTQKLYVIGVVGHEVWKSDYGVAAIVDSTGMAPTALKDFENAKFWHAAPIDYSDWMYGIGIDWDIAPRVGLHVRLQRFTHEDKGISKEVPLAAGKNDYQAWLLHAETKMWF